MEKSNWPISWWTSTIPPSNLDQTRLEIGIDVDDEHANTKKKSLAQEVSPHKHAHPYCLYQYLNNLKQFVSCPMSEYMEASFKQGFYRFQSTES